MTTETVDIRLRTPGIQKTQQELKRVDDELDEVSQSAKGGILPFAALGLVGGFLAGRLGDLAFRSAGLASSFSQLTALFEDIGDVVIQLFEPSIRSLLRVIISLLNVGWINTLAAWTAGAVLIATALWATARASDFVLRALGRLWDGLKAGLSALREFGGEWARFTRRMGYIKDVEKQVGIVTKAFVTLSRAVQSVIGIFYSFFDTLGDSTWQKFLARIFEGLLGFVQNVSNRILKFTGQLDEIISNRFPRFAEAASATFDRVYSIVARFVSGTINLINRLLGFIRRLFSIGDNVISIGAINTEEFDRSLKDLYTRTKESLNSINMLFENFKPKVPPVETESSKGFLDDFINFIRRWGARLAAAFDDVINFLRRWGGNILRFFGDTLSVLRRWGSSIVEFFSNTGRRVSEIIGNWKWVDNVTSILGRILRIVGRIAPIIEGLFLIADIRKYGVIEGLKEWWSGWVDLAGIILTVGKHILGIPVWIIERLLKLTGLVNEQWNLHEKYIQKAGSAIDWFKDKAQTWADAYIDYFAEVAETVPRLFSGLWDAVSSISSSAVDFIIGQINRIKEAISAAIGSLGSALDSIAGRFQGLKNAISNFKLPFTRIPGVSGAPSATKNTVVNSTRLVGSRYSTQSDAARPNIRVTVNGDVSGRKLIDDVSRLVGTNAPRNYAAGFVG